MRTDEGGAVRKDRACWRCEFFDRDSDETEDGGFCRRFPPESTNNGVMCLWPGVEYLDWCGEYKEVE